MSGRHVAAALACFSLLVPSCALAQQTVAPPGNSGIDEYLETVPAAGGNHKPGSGTGTLSPAAKKALDALGADGRAAAAASEATGQPGSHRPSAGRPEKGSPIPANAPELKEPSGNPFSALGRLFEGSSDQGGLGAWLPILLAFTAAGFIAVMFLRRRSSS